MVMTNSLNQTNNEDLTLADIEPLQDTTQTGQPAATYTPGYTISQPGYEEPEVYEPDELGTVEGRLTGILAKENPYMQGARERGKQFAHRRGLLNTTMAASAGEKSAIEAALPIAQQDAQTVSKAGLAEQQFEQEKALTEIQAGASSQLEAQQQEGANYRQEREIALKERLSLADVSLSEKNSMATQMTSLGDNFQAKLAGIQVDPTLSDTAKTEAIQSLQSAYEANLQSLGSIYGVEISWGNNTGNTNQGLNLAGVSNEPPDLTNPDQISFEPGEPKPTDPSIFSSL